MPKLERVVTRALDVAGRVPKHNEDLERELVAIVLEQSKYLDDVVHIAPPEAFYVTSCRTILEAAVAVRAAGQPVDIQTVGAWLNARDKLQAVGGMNALSTLVLTAPSVLSVETYAKIVAGLALQRRVTDAAALVHGEGYAFAGEPADFVNFAVDAISKAAERPEDARLELMPDVLTRRMGEIVDGWHGRRSAAGMLTGFARYDQLTGGWKLGHLHTMAAYTGGGKSAFALQCAVNLAGQEYNGERVGVVYVSAEMPKEELADRALCQLAGISDEQLRFCTYPESKNDPLNQAVRRLEATPIAIFDSAASVADVRSCIARAQRQFDKHADPNRLPIKVRLVVIDYLQIMQLGDADRQDLAIGAFTRAMKQLALDERVHVVLISQFNRDAAKRGGRPSMFDLKESGAIENDSNLITLIHRPSITMEVESAEAKAWEEYAELIVAKSRGGGKGHERVAFRGPFFRFEAPTESDLNAWRSAASMYGGGGKRKGGS